MARGQCRSKAEGLRVGFVNSYGNKTPSEGRSLNRFNASAPKWTSTGTPVFCIRPGWHVTRQGEVAGIERHFP
jgi:hypothetical protein